MEEPMWWNEMEAAALAGKKCSRLIPMMHAAGKPKDTEHGEEYVIKP